VDDLIAWLRAQLDDDERVARGHVADGLHSDCEPQPVRWLAEVEAKRRILNRYQAQLDRQGDWQESQLSADICAQEYADWVLPMLALPYADQPGYRDEWRP
jgi:hypothetical protein